MNQMTLGGIRWKLKWRETGDLFSGLAVTFCIVFCNRLFTSSALIRSHFNKLWKPKEKKKKKIWLSMHPRNFSSDKIVLFLRTWKRPTDGFNALRKLKKCKVPSPDIVHIYWALIRFILEYASAAFADLPKYLACYLENVHAKKGRFLHLAWYFVWGSIWQSYSFWSSGSLVC